MAIKRIHVKDRSDTDYPEYAGVIKKNGELYVATIDSGSFCASYGDAERELKKQVQDNEEIELVAVVKFTHLAYAHPEKIPLSYAADLILEAAAEQLYTPYAIVNRKQNR